MGKGKLSRPLRRKKSFCLFTYSYSRHSLFQIKKNIRVVYKQQLTFLQQYRLLMFYENAHSVAMILHAMNMIKAAVNHINPSQIPVISLYQPLFALEKLIQWNWPSTRGEDKFILMLDGLHIEMAAFELLGDWLDGSGWTSALVAAEVATGGVAGPFIKATHVTKTRRVHQVTAACLFTCRVRYILIILNHSRMVKNHSSLQIGSITCPKIAHSFSTRIEFSFWSYVFCGSLELLEKGTFHCIRSHLSHLFRGCSHLTTSTTPGG